MKTGWIRVKFGDVVRQVKDKDDPKTSGLERYIAGEHMDTDDLRIRRWGEINEDYLGPAFHMRFKPGQVLYGSRRTYLRKVAVPDFEGICANTTYVLESKDPSILLPELLPFIMQTEAFHEHSIKQSKGSVNPYINFSDIAWFEFALPPQEEQRHIVRLFTSSWHTSESLERALESLRTLRKSSIDALCTRKDGEKPTLGDICSMQNGRAFPGKDYQDEGLRLLRPGNLGISGYLEWNSKNTTHLPEAYEVEAADYIIRPGDILINLTAQSLEDGFMGRVCLAKDDDHSLLNQRIGRFDSWIPNVIPEYVYRVLQSSRFQQHVISMCEGTKVKHIYWRHIERFEFNLPAPGVQGQIVSDLMKIDSTVRQLEKRLKQQKNLHTSIINGFV